MIDAKHTAENLKGVASDEAATVRQTSEDTAAELMVKASAEAERLISAAKVAADHLERENFDKAEAIVLMAKETARLLEENIERAISPLKQAADEHRIAIKRSIELAEASLAANLKVLEKVEGSIKILQEWDSNR